MKLVLTLVAVEPSVLPAARERAELALEPMGVRVGAETLLGPAALDLALDAPLALTEAAIVRAVRLEAEQALEGLGADLCVQAPEGRRKALFVADMDSTVIGCECIDELADFAGVKAEVAEITERAMRGEIDFEGALRERVAKLRGLPVEVLGRCYDERVRLNPGARTLVRTQRAAGTRCVLVSGGFTFFTGKVAEAAGFHDHRANRLGEADGALTGKVHEPILGRQAKLTALLEEATALGVSPRDALAVGDGANDLAMIQAAGLGVAYRAKPVVAAQADARVDVADLTALLYFQGYRAEEFAS